jgi:ribosome-associated protein
MEKKRVTKNFGNGLNTRANIKKLCIFATNIKHKKQTIVTIKTFMDETQLLVQKIIEGIQEKKGNSIVLADMTKLEAVCRYFVICEGTSNTQILAVAGSVKDYVRDNMSIKPYATDGLQNALWIAMDYGDVMVHVFERDTRAFYNLEHLWSDAILTEIPDLE